MIETLAFGRSGHMSTRTLFGAAALSSVTQDEADRTLEVLQQYGVNHIDVAASYGDAELRVGPWMDRYRDQFFLATKTGDRTYQEAKDSIHRSLERLRTDHVDLIQFHNLVDPIERDQVFAPGGALEAAVEARAQGLVRHIGVTGHGIAIPGMHRRSLAQYDLDSVLLPYNFVTMRNSYYADEFEALLATCRERDVAVQTIKSIARRPWGEQTHTRATWYAPLEDQADIDRAVWWVLGRPGVFLNTVGDIHVLPKVLDAASRYEARPSDAEMAATMEQTQTEPLFV
jgi:aryl-alcohol dehydrogenase-like predicted oxidoreductase